MPTEAQKRAHAKHEASRKRTPLWLEEPERRQLDKIKRRERLPSRVAVLRYLLVMEDKFGPL